MNRRTTSRPAITLVEVLVVLAILGILLGLMIPAVLKIRASMAQAECSNKLKQIALACHTFHDSNNRLPPAFGFFPKADITSGTSGLGNVFFHLLPYVEQDVLYEKSRHQPASKPQQDFFFYTANNIHQQQVPLFNCPSDPTLMPGVNPATNYAPSSYAANYLVFGNVDANYTNRNAQGRPVLPASFPDGTGTTLLFVEKYASAWLDAKTGSDPGNAGGQTPFSRKGGCHWAYFQADCHNSMFAYFDPIPKQNPITDANAVGPKHAADPRDGRFQVQPNPKGGCNPCLPATGHSTMNAAMADGSVRQLAAGMDRLIWWALVTPAGRDRTE